MRSKLFAIVLSGFFIVMSFLSIANTTEPGDPGSEPGTGDTPLGGPAPIGSGMTILIGLGAAYGCFKLNKKEDSKEEESK